MIGHVTIDKAGLDKWAAEELRKIGEHERAWMDEHWSDHLYFHQDDLKDAQYIVEKYSNLSLQDRTKDFTRLLQQCESENIQLQLFYMDDVAASVGYKNHRFIIPSEYIENYQLLKDYSGITSGELKLISNPSVSEGLFPADINDTSMSQLNDEIKSQKDAIEATEKEYQLKIDAIREEALKKERELRALLAQETAKLQQVKEELEQKLMVLDTQIYGIRCYLGEVVDFHKIRSGKSMDEDTPVIVYQKV